VSDLKRYRIHFKSKRGDQYMKLMARNPEEAKNLAVKAQYRRQERFPLTFQRIEQSLTGAALKTEMERRKRDLARYEEDDLKIVSVKEAPL
jgi:hypothetical protein